MMQVLTPTHVTITLYSHHFVVSKLSPRGRGACISFCKPLMTYKFPRKNRWGGMTEREPESVYAASNMARSYFRFHINQLEDFKVKLAEMGIDDSLIEWVIEQPVQPVAIDFKLKKHIQPYAGQVPMVDFLAKAPHISRQLGLQTGGGKGIISMAALSQLAMRTIVMVKPKYIEKWVKELIEKCDIPTRRIMVIKGGAALKSMLNLAAVGQLDVDIIIISTTTLQLWITEYEEKGDDCIGDGLYACAPQDLFRHTGSGVKLIDESHEQFHLLFKIDLYTHCVVTIGLTATLISEDSLISHMHEVMYPPLWRAPVPALKRHTGAWRVNFHFKNPDMLRTSIRGSSAYSHGELEKSIMKHVPTLLNYYRLVEEVLKAGYFSHPRKTKRAAIYCASTELCTKMVAWFSQKYPEYDIRRYCASLKDPYKDVIEADIRFSTIGSSGTAIDIPDLVATVLTIGLSSIQANIQVFGRNRELQETSEGAADNETNFYYFVASNIDRQVVYSRAKQEMFLTRAKFHKDFHAGIPV